MKLATVKSSAPRAKLNQKTYEDWQLVGRQVKKGEKAVSRDDRGTALFHISQTKTIPSGERECFGDGFWDNDRYQY